MREFVDDTRIFVGAPGDDEQVFILGEDLVDAGLRVGDAVVVDSRTHYALQVVEKPEVSSLLLEEVPDITYSDSIGGWPIRSARSRTQWNCPSSTRSSTPSTVSNRRRASCSTALPAVARP
ncbi:hypothetical protein [Brevibacterium sp. UCMA 11754]|uniref:hypothetical protein n=1 Tax=Brevibacterium sp. UCMA 11754 TaxID=2749198 RepID=UPI001F2FE6CE|nr:hypothetical protein [Brevibacterium sp. UCMA 11754]